MGPAGALGRGAAADDDGGAAPRGRPPPRRGSLGTRIPTGGGGLWGGGGGGQRGSTAARADRGSGGAGGGGVVVGDVHEDGIGSVLHEYVTRLYYRHGLFIASNPFRCMLAVILLSLFCSFPALPLLDDDVLPNPVMWRAGSGTQPPDWVDGDPTVHMLQVVVTPSDGLTALRHDFAHNVTVRKRRELLDFGFEFGGSMLRLEDFCYKDPNGECVILSLAELWAGRDTPDSGELRELVSASASIAHATDPRLLIDRGALVVGLTGSGRSARGKGLVLTVLLRADLHPLSLTEPRPEYQAFLSAAVRAVFPQGKLRTNLQAAAEPSLSINPAMTVFVRYERRRRQLAEDTYLGVAYLLVFLYIYFVVGKFELVKSNFGLGVAAVLIVIASMSVAVGICKFFGLVTTLTAVEVVPFLVMAIGLDNMTVITKHIVSTSPGLAVRYRIAQGLSTAGIPLSKSMLCMITLLLFGVYSNIPALQEFCVVACISVLADYFLQVVFYVSILSVDIRRMELTDLARHKRRSIAPAESHVASAAGVSTGGDSRFTARVLKTVLDSGSQLVMLNNVVILLSMLGTMVLALLSGATLRPEFPSPTIQHVEWKGALFRPVEHELPSYFGLLPVTYTGLQVSQADAHDLGEESILQAIRHYVCNRSPGVCRFRVPHWLLETHTMAQLVLAGIVLGYLLRRLLQFLRRLLFGIRVGDDMVKRFALARMELHTFEGHQFDVECMSVSDGQIVSACLGGQVRVWDLETQRCKATLRYANQVERDQNRLPWSVAVSNNIVAVGCRDGTIEVWSLEGGVQFLKVQAGIHHQDDKSQRCGITNVAFVGRNVLATTAAGYLQLWEPRATLSATDVHESHSTGDLLAAANASRIKTHRRNSSAGAYISSFIEHYPGGSSGSIAGSSGSLANSASQQSLPGVQFEAPTSEYVCTSNLRCHKASITCLQITDRFVFTASADRQLKIIGKKDLVCAHTLYGHEYGITTIDVFEETVLASGSVDTTVRVWDVATGVSLNVFEGHKDSILCVRINSLFIVSSSEDDTIRVWHRRRGSSAYVLRMYASYLSFALHSSSVLITAADGELSAYDLMAGGEHLRTVPLNDEVVPAGLAHAPGSNSTGRILLNGDRVVCDLGRLLKTVALPIPADRHLKNA